MQLKTSSLEFERYGSVYDKPVSPGNTGMISRDLHLIGQAQPQSGLSFRLRGLPGAAKRHGCPCGRRVP